MNADEKDLIVVLLHEISSLKAQVAALQSFCMDLLLEKQGDKAEALQKVEHIYQQVEAGARRSTAIRVRKLCASVDEDTLKKWGLI